MERIAFHADEVRRFVAQRIANPSDAEDIAQEALCVACEKLDTYRNGNFRAWLFTIARNMVVDHYRQQNRFTHLDLEEVACTEQEPKLKTHVEVVPELCDARDRLRCYLGITQQLRLEEQVAVLLADLIGYPDRDSATAMGTSLPSFKLLLHHARAQLRRVDGVDCPVGGRDSISEAAPAAQGCAEKRHEGDRVGAQVPTPAVRLRADPIERGASQDRSVACAESRSVNGVCPLGMKCCRLVPQFRVLRDRLLDELRAGLLCRALLAIGLATPGF